jgi:hypothetical protein
MNKDIEIRYRIKLVPKDLDSSIATSRYGVRAGTDLYTKAGLMASLRAISPHVRRLFNIRIVVCEVTEVDTVKEESLLYRGENG